MRALVLETFNRMAVEERPDPVAGEGEVLLRIVATGICGSDLHGYTGENGRRVPGQVMGHESVATIEAVGPGVDAAELMPGRVATFNPVVVPDEEVEPFRGREQHAPGKTVIGVASDVVASFAQLIVVPARNVVVLPDDMPISYGALIEPFAVALHAVRRLGVTLSDRLLVIGGGPIGQSIVLAGRHLGVQQIVVSEVDPARRELCQQLGAYVLDPSSESPQEVLLGLWGQLADCAADAVGIGPTMSTALSSTRLGGSICLVGMGAKQIELDAYRVSTEERTIMGSFTYSSVDFADAAAWIGTGPDAARHLITREVPLDEGPDAFAALAAHDGTPGKVLVRLDK